MNATTGSRLNDWQPRSAKAAIATRMRVLLCIALVLSGSRAQAAIAGSAPFIIDGNRIYATVLFQLPGGKTRETLVFVDLGSPSMILSKRLYEALKLSSRQALAFRIGRKVVNIPADDVSSNSWLPFSIGENRKVEGVLPAGLLQKFQVRFDYAARTMLVSDPNTQKLQGTAVPFQINRKTGLIAVEATIDSKSYPITIDNGSGYSWIRQSAALKWIEHHPDWLRGIGAVGPANMRMADDGIETSGKLLRIPDIRLGALSIEHMGALAIAPDNRGQDFMDWYSKKNPTAVIGWLGGNVLRHFALTIDYPNKLSYWLPQSALDAHDLDCVGLTLLAKHGEFFVAGIVTQDDRPTVKGAKVGDKLLKIGTLQTRGASREAIFAAMHGNAGEIRSLILERDGSRIELDVPATAF